MQTKQTFSVTHPQSGAGQLKGRYDKVQANGAKLANTRIDNTGGTAI
jgi:hypothetical protein